MIFIRFYLLTQLGGHKTARAKVMKTSHIGQVVSSVQRKMGPTRCLSADISVRNIANEYYGRIELDPHADTTILGPNCFILTYTGNDFEVSPYSDDYKSIQHVPVVTGATLWTCPQSRETFILMFNEA